MDIKQRPNHKQYIETLRRMTPEQRLIKAFELSKFSKKLFIHGLRKRFPDLDEEEFHKLYMERLEKCYNRKDRSEGEFKIEKSTEHRTDCVKH